MFLILFESVSSYHQAHQHGSLTGQFAIKGWESDGKGLQCTQREAVIHGEDVLCYAAKLHHNVILWKKHQGGGGGEKLVMFWFEGKWWWCRTIVRMDDLEVLDGSLGDPSMEVEHVWLSLFVPGWGFVHQGDQFVCVTVCMTNEEGLQLLWWRGNS